MADIEDLYAILGLVPTASAEEIRAAYRRKALQAHPDVMGSSDSAEFVRLNRAYETLGDPVRRRRYDEVFFSYRRQTTYAEVTVARQGGTSNAALGSVLGEMMSAVGAAAGFAPLEQAQRLPFT